MTKIVQVSVKGNKEQLIKEAQEHCKSKGITFSEYILDLIEKDKKNSEALISPIFSASICESTEVNNNMSTLDIYFEPSELNQYIQQETDLDKLYAIRRNSKLVLQVVDTRIERLPKRNTQKVIKVK